MGYFFAGNRKEKEKERKKGKKFSRQMPGDKTKNKNYEQTLTQK